MPQVYPRVCGGTPASDCAAVRLAGLSPRVRGNPELAGAETSTSRSIPACAGEPDCRFAGGAPRTVYPRVCGGTCLISGMAACGGGLSPRVRGNRLTNARRCLRCGSIPACAGEPRRCQCDRRHVRVYPRVCGGTCDGSVSRKNRQGLSPRVRGNLRRIGQQKEPAGSIPACAGEPGVYHRLNNAWEVYPRVCGGTFANFPATSASAGLSPRVRGNPLRCRVAGPKRRSIPACAGEPAASAHCGSRSPVYPRVCGGTSASTRWRKSDSGLSPRVRGNPPYPGVGAARGRSIPACAGEPIRLPKRMQAHTVYPRVCGGTHIPAHGSTYRTGLSPRVRGNPAWQRSKHG